MDALLLFATLVLAGLLIDARRRIAALERAIGGEAPSPRTAAIAPPKPWKRTAKPSSAPGAAPAAPARAAIDFESIIGGRLPIWIGGAALVLAGFFLVRVAIEQGFLGPAARSVLAALFAATLVAASEAARRIPLLRDDARIGQVLAGAGVASGYATLYLAAAYYRLMPPLPAFGIMLCITAIGLLLASRHGPPTAIMALAGGFLAPMVAGYDAAGLGALLVYLALFLAAIFALAARRGWGWLAILAVFAGFGWAAFLAVIAGDRGGAALGLFVVALAIGGTLALPAAGVARTRWRIAPLATGLAQMLLLAPALSFDALAWSFHFVLAAAAVTLAWRDARLVAAPPIAALLATVLVAIAAGSDDGGPVLAAALALSLVLALPALLRSRDDRAWAITAVIGAIGPVIALDTASPSRLPVTVALLAYGVAAAAFLAMAWRHRDRVSTSDAGLIGGMLGAVAALAAAATTIGGTVAEGPVFALGILAIHIVARRLRAPALDAAAALPLLAAAVAAAPLALAFVALALASLFGDRTPFTELPALGRVFPAIVLPAAAAAFVLARGGFDRLVRPATMLTALGLVASLYALAKQPLAIADEARFLALGFGERAAITLMFVAAAWGAARASMPRIAAALLAVAALRFVWFDLFILNPLQVPQSVGAWPLLNAAMIAPAIAVLLLMRWPRPGRRTRAAAMMLALVAALAGVRHLAHAPLLVGPVTTAENWGYSAALLLLAILWLARGMNTGLRDLRFAGLGLMLAVALKIFTVDIALDGLLRVVSFLGIGVTLIALSWFYTRYLKTEAGAAPTPR